MLFFFSSSENKSYSDLTLSNLAILVIVRRFLHCCRRIFHIKNGKKSWKMETAEITEY